MISKELVTASTQPLILALLAEGEDYGYALIQRVRALSGNQIEWSEGMLYPFLHWLEREGLVEAEWREPEAGRRRKYYRLSPEGRMALKSDRAEWMAVHTTLTTLWKRIPNLA